MNKVLIGLVALISISFSLAQYPEFAQDQGYLMNDGRVQEEQNINSISNWWGAKRGKIASDTCPITISTKYGDSLWCYAISNYSHNDILVKILGFNNRSDTIPIIVPAGYSTSKLQRIWKIVSTNVTSSTLDSMVLWFQNGKKNPNQL